MANQFSFEAIRGIQARTAYYSVMIPLRHVPRLFVFDDDELPADMRAQRVVSRSRIPQIASYLSENHDDYILSSLCASVDGDLVFEAAAPSGELRNVGILRFSMDAKILLNDGQHRRAAIEAALKTRPELENETISVVLFADRGLKRSQQMFADLNKNAVRPSGSINVLFDHRNPLARLSADVVSAVPFLQRFVELERTSISNRACKLYTLSSLNQAHELMFGPGLDSLGDGATARATEFWTELFSTMQDWKRLDGGAVTSADLRSETVHAHGVMLQAFGLFAAALFDQRAETWREDVSKLGAIDWSRRNSLWEGRVLHNGRVNGQKRAVFLGAAVLFRAAGLEIDQRLKSAEEGLPELRTVGDFA